MPTFSRVAVSLTISPRAIKRGEWITYQIYKEQPSVHSLKPKEEPHRCAIPGPAGLVGFEDRGLAALDDVPGAAHGGRVHGDDLAHDRPVEQHADGGEVLLDGGGAVARPRGSLHQRY